MAIMLCSRLTPSGLTLAAIRPSVSPWRTVTAPGEPASDTRAFGGAAAAGSRSGAARRLGAAALAGRAAGDAAAASGGATTGACASALARASRICGGSSSTVYSRTSLPVAQFSSSRRSTKGSLIGWFELILMKVRPALGSTVKRSPPSAGLYSSPACRKASAGANRADKDCDSSAVSEVTSTSPRNGWPSAD